MLRPIIVPAGLAKENIGRFATGQLFAAVARDECRGGFGDYALGQITGSSRDGQRLPVIVTPVFEGLSALNSDRARPL